MTNPVDLEEYFTRIAEKVRIPNIADDQIVFGRDYAHTNGAHAQSLREADASFSWLAYAFGDIPMWMLHVGVVIGEDVASAGIHVHDAASPGLAEVVQEAAGASWESKFSELAKEIQFNEVFAVSDANVARIGDFLSNRYLRTLAILEKRGLVTN